MGRRRGGPWLLHSVWFYKSVRVVGISCWKLTLKWFHLHRIFYLKYFMVNWSATSLRPVAVGFYPVSEESPTSFNHFSLVANRSPILRGQVRSQINHWLPAKSIAECLTTGQRLIDNQIKSKFSCNSRRGPESVAPETSCSVVASQSQALWDRDVIWCHLSDKDPFQTYLGHCCCIFPYVNWCYFFRFLEVNLSSQSLHALIWPNHSNTY